ncbi:choice-of-anchor J domain-containing protein [Flavobacterium sp. HSC-61S13]|uniref:choice-of-anchor J domain-containing protein n=1 Tax=Flavobacterium sp. HSC-61S13 TaxID=2910963 RepID=UPI00209F2188|nr:choice-of-anchor J domain-containing protein [Flavobacterium sp. HSC-61S13]MCP1995112.1 gliding motility-associated-like protein [Flavobacterium sp. HSC-61S13]
MNKLNLLFSFFIFFLGFLFTNTKSYGAGLRTEIYEEPVLWQARAFAPELYLQPCFIFESLAVLKTTNPANVVFSDDFDGVVKWTFFNDTYNGWYIGTAVNNGGAKSMYISDDSGVSNTYSGSAAVSHAVSQAIPIAANTSEYLLSFDWRLAGEKITSVYDYMNVWVIPTTFTPTAGSRISVTSSGGVKVKEHMCEQVAFVEEKIVVDLTQYAGQQVKIVFEWINDSSVFNQPPAAVDNVELSKVSCPGPKNLVQSQVQTTSAVLAWTAPSGSTADNYEVYLSTDNTAPTGNQTPVITVTNALTTTLTNLTPNQNYFVWVRKVCAATDKSIWVGPVNFRTLCMAFSLPFWEGFNSDSTTQSCWKIVDQNKDSTSPTGSNIWRPYNFGTFQGNGCMYFYGGPRNDDWLISPQFTVDSTKTYKLRYHYKTSTSYDNEFEVLASTNGFDISDFTRVVVPKKIDRNGDWREEIVYLDNLHGSVYFAWHVTTQSYTYLYIDHVFVDELECIEPQNLEFSNILTSQATVSWQDSINNSWEYYVDELNGNGPMGAGVPTTTTQVVLTNDFNNSPLTANTIYDFYVRAKCVNGIFGEWIGPFNFRTDCLPMVLPYSEGFNTTSNTYACWTIIDHNNDRMSNGANAWRQHNSSVHEGDRTMYFDGRNSSTTHDDYLISPEIEMNGGIYAITYYYRTSTSYSNEFEVLLSTTGKAPANFTTVLQPAEKRNNATYIKKTLFVQNVTGIVHLAWHVVATGTADVYIDLVSIKKIDCYGPDEEVEVTDIKKDEATFEWKDSVNANWEYYVQLPSGVQPVGSGALTKTKKQKVNRTSGSGSVNLQPDTWYEFYVRSSCGPGKNSPWVGPILFKTSCDALPLPYWEGFNTTSPSIQCWRIIDANNDATSPTGSNIWTTSGSFDSYEGNRAMSFYGQSNRTHDDWLISPAFNINASKIYRLKYHFKTSTSYSNDFRVMLSTNGNAVNDFNTVLAVENGHRNSSYLERKMFVDNITAEINIAWQVTTQNSATYLYLDNVFFEEVLTCPEPLALNTKDEKYNEVTLLWSDKYGSSWEYVVQQPGGSVPTTAGIATNSKETIVTQDFTGNAFQPNSPYEFYVRTSCGNGEYSEWSGPFDFRTGCIDYPTPFWEGFNADSKSLICWTVVDENGDVTPNGNSNIWRLSTTRYEGTHAAYFDGFSSGSDTLKLPHNDWLISPKIVMEQNKFYRLKYHYRTASSTTYDYEFEVLASNLGVDTKNFTKVVVPKKKYDPITQWRQEYVFISGITGAVNIAWHVTSSSRYTDIYVDNVFIEEVTGCPEPLKLGVTAVGKREVTMSWTDDFNANSWEYYIQKEGGGPPVSNGLLTNQKQTTATLDHLGVLLEHNTDYEYYVRTVCGNGAYSIWNGPFKFVTLCDYYESPFWEGFNSNTNTIRCWTSFNKDKEEIGLGSIWRTTTSNVYEGNQAMYYSGVKPYDDWLISPNFRLDGGLYMLKYHYRTSTGNDNNFEVRLSTQGADVTKFDSILVPAKTYRLGDYVEEVVFVDKIQADVYIGWHVGMVSNNNSYLYLDNIHLKKVINCPEPYYVKIVDQTDTTVDLEWQQYGSTSQWEVLVVDYGQDETATPISITSVSGNPQTTITGLQSGRAYTFYVRAKCQDGQTTSDWSTSRDGMTVVNENNGCEGAITIPVSEGFECEQVVSASTLNMETATVVRPSCENNTTVKRDIWFEFTAKYKQQELKLKDWKGSSRPTLYAALYGQSCDSITNTAIECFTLTSSITSKSFNNLTPGQKYYVRLATTSANLKAMFNLCIISPHYLEVSPSGEDYTLEELVKDVLIKSNCDLVSNVRYQNGDGSPKAMSYNTVGYFNKGQTDFPFEEGIVLSTNEVQYVPGPAQNSSFDRRGANDERWLGDKDINDAIADAGGGPVNIPKKRVTQIEFDFFSIKDSIKFEYLFASNSYHSDCTNVGCAAGALFAAWLIDETTGEGVNLAKIKGTDVPIALHTITDTSKTGKNCPSSYPELYWKHYANNVDNPYYGYIDFVGLTRPMESETVHVIPGRKYRIKLAVIDFCSTVAHSSAVFFNAGSFNLGNLDLGADLLVSQGTALCDTECVTIHSGLGIDNVGIQWFKDGQLIVGADQPDLEVCESGVYKVIGEYTEIGCMVEGERIIEIFPPISTVMQAPETLDFCRKSVVPIVLDLTQIEAQMLSGATAEDYQFAYYQMPEEMEIVNPQEFLIENPEINKTIQIRVDDLRTGCVESFNWLLRTNTGIIPEDREDIHICGAYLFPDLEAGQHYYTKSAKAGQEYKSGDLLSEPGVHTIFVLQDNGGDCYEEVSYQVSITAEVIADVFDDKTLECENYILEPLTGNNRYFTQAGGQGQELVSGTVIRFTQTIYVYAKSDDGLCIDESDFTLTFNECPIPRGISPNGDGKNDRFDLSNHGISGIKIYNRYGAEVFSFDGHYTDQWAGQNKNGKMLPDGTYYYVVIAHGKTRTGWVQINR